jgi:hypothetical protein
MNSFRPGVADRSRFSVQTGRPLIRDAPETREVFLSEPAPSRAAFVAGGSAPGRHPACRGRKPGSGRTFALSMTYTGI